MDNASQGGGSSSSPLVPGPRPVAPNFRPLVPGPSIMAVEKRQNVRINIAGITVCLVCDDPVITEQLLAWYGDFLRPDDSPVVTVKVIVKAGIQFIPIEPGSWLIRSSLQEGRLVFQSYFESGWVDLDRGRGELVMAPDSSVENFLRVLYAYLAIERGALLVHASGVVMNDKAYVFFGPSGSGKTTTAKLSADRLILSDDMVFLKKVDGRIRAYGVPFRGDLPETPRNNVSARVAGIFRLRKADHHIITAMKPLQALAEMVACLPFVMSSPALIQQVLALAHEAIELVPISELYFRPDPGFWEVIGAGGQGSGRGARERVKSCEDEK
jgi:hypothetical protein